MVDALFTIYFVPAMPKRKCPYGDNSPLQLKNYIRIKELNEGVLGDYEKKKIFEKTKQLLFLGAQNNLEPAECMLNTRNCDSPMEAQEETTSSGQMCIGTNGQLVMRTKDISTDDASVMDVEGFAKKNEVQKSKEEPKCDFCEKSISCLQTCVGCGGFFCSMCSVFNYDENFERIFCLNCS